MMKRYVQGGDLTYWSAEQIKSFEFMQNLGVPRKDEMLKVMIDVLSLQKAKPRLLEIGGGSGTFTEMILKKYSKAHLVFLDGSSAMISKAKRKLNKCKGHITFLQRDINQPNWYKGIGESFDAIVSSWCLHYLADDRRDPFFKEINSFLRPSGVFLYSCSVQPENKKFLRLYNKLESFRVKEFLKRQGIELTDDQIKEMAHRGHSSARINPAYFDEYLMLMKGAGFTSSGCIWKYLFSAVFVGYK